MIFHFINTINKELNPEIEFYAFNLMASIVVLFCFTEVIDEYTSIFELNHEYSFEDFYDLILINDESIPSINKEALLHAFFIFKRIFSFVTNFSYLFKISFQKRQNRKSTKQFYNLESRGKHFI